MFCAETAVPRPGAAARPGFGHGNRRGEPFADGESPEGIRTRAVNGPFSAKSPSRPGGRINGGAAPKRPQNARIWGSTPTAAVFQRGNPLRARSGVLSASARRRAANSPRESGDSPHSRSACIPCARKNGGYRRAAAWESTGRPGPQSRKSSQARSASLRAMSSAATLASICRGLLALTAGSRPRGSVNT